MTSNKNRHPFTIWTKIADQIHSTVASNCQRSITQLPLPPTCERWTVNPLGSSVIWEQSSVAIGEPSSNPQVGSTALARLASEPASAQDWPGLIEWLLGVVSWQASSVIARIRRSGGEQAAAVTSHHEMGRFGSWIGPIRRSPSPTPRCRWPKRTWPRSAFYHTTFTANGTTESAGINRHRARNGGVRHRRSSDPRWPRVMRWRPVRAQRSVDRGRAGRAIEPRNQCNRGAHAVVVAEGHIAGGAMCEPSKDPARSENQGMYASSMRENRESPSSPAA